MFKHRRPASDSAPAVHLLASDPAPAAAQRLLAAASALALLAALALTIDMPAARWFQEQALPGDLRHFIRLAEVFGWGGSVAVIVLLAATLDPRGWKIVPRLAAASLGAGIAADVVKLFVARLRPSAADLAGRSADTFTALWPLRKWIAGDITYGFAQQSFPSAHAATAVGLAIGLAALYPRGRWMFFALAILAGVQRLDAHAHFASDVLAGAALACVLSAGLSRWPAHRRATAASVSSPPSAFRSARGAPADRPGC